MINITGFTFLPIHDFVPQKATITDGNQNARYIALSNGENNNYDN